MTASNSHRAPAFRSSQRISITLPHHVATFLQERCDDEGRSLSNLAAYLLESSLSREGGSVGGF
jgi:hypothetical protein